MGALSADVADLAFQAGRPVSSMVRQVQQASSRTFLYHYVHKYKAALAGAVALEKVQRMQAGKGNAADVFDLMKLGWELPDARRLAQGRGSQAEYNRVVRQVPPMLLGQNAVGSQHSRLAHSRIARAALAFQHWFEMKVRSWVKETEAFAKVMHKGTPREKIAATQKYARSQLGTALSHMIPYFLLALATGGLAGLKVAWNESKAHPAKFLAESWMYGVFGGPFAAAIHLASGNGSLVDSIFPFRVIHEIVNYARGVGIYAHREPLDKAKEFMNKFIPADQVGLQTAAAIFGYQQQRRELETATRAYYRWRADAHPFKPHVYGENPDEADEKFRDAMRKAYSALVNGDEDPAQYIRDAMGAKKNPESIAASLRSRMLLSKAKLEAPDEAAAEKMRVELLAQIGTSAYNTLVNHDAVLARMAVVMSAAEGDPELAKQYAAKYGNRMVELERERSEAKPGTEKRAELDSRKREIEQVIHDTRITPGLSARDRRQSREEAMDDVLGDISAR